MLGRMRIIIVSLMSAFCIDKCVNSPVRTPKDVLLIPSRFSPPYIPMYHPFYQSRGPFDFLGNWIQSSEWFPVEINVPDTIANIGNGIGGFAQNVGNGFQTLTQNVGSGIQSFAQNLAQRFPVLAVVVRPNAPARYFVLLPTKSVNSFNENKNEIKNDAFLNQMHSDILESFP